MADDDYYYSHYHSHYHADDNKYDESYDNDECDDDYDHDHDEKIMMLTIMEVDVETGVSPIIMIMTSSSINYDDDYKNYDYNNKCYNDDDKDDKEAASTWPSEVLKFRNSFCSIPAIS